MALRAATAVLVGVLVSMWATSTRAAERWTGKVIGISAGDAITVLHNRTPVKIRLHGVDAPEKAQPFGKRAKQLTSRLVLGQVVRVDTIARGRYGRTLARVSYLGKLHRNPLDRSRPHQVVTVYHSLQQALVQAGLAWWSKSQAPGESKLARLEAEARRARRGLWADKDPVAPWSWRRGRRTAQPPGALKGPSKIQAVRRPGGGSGRFKVGGVITKVSPPERPRSKGRACQEEADCVFAPRSGCGCPPCGDTWRRAVNRKQAAWLRGEYARESCPKVKCARCARPVRWRGTRAYCVKGQCDVLGEVKLVREVHGNTRSRVFHDPRCRHYNCKSCTARFRSRQAAVKKGYRPCGVCKP